MVLDEARYEKFAAGRFSILDDVRTVQAGEGVYATLSIGVGREAADFEALYKNAGLALEMALSRGGDQAVVKDQMKLRILRRRGAKSTEKRTKVKSRVMANALGELIDDARHVYDHGPHVSPTWTALGAAAGMCAHRPQAGQEAARYRASTCENNVRPCP